MSWEVYLAFVLTACIILVIPGPTVLMLIGLGLSEGRRATLYAAAGVTLGDCTVMTLSLLGLGALLHASAGLFTVVKLAGACYLIWLGLQMMLRKPGKASGSPSRSPVELSRRRILRRAWLVTTLNPKALTFFMALMPQFVNANAPAAPQLLLLGGTFLCLSFVNSFSYTMLAGSARQLLANPAAMRGLRLASGAACVSAGVWTALRKAH